MTEAKDYFDNIQALFDKYQNNSYMLQRLCYHITDILPSTLDTEEKNHEKRVERTAFLTKEQQTFIQVFLNKNQYYYLSNNNCFYQYSLYRYPHLFQSIYANGIVQQCKAVNPFHFWWTNLKFHFYRY